MFGILSLWVHYALRKGINGCLGGGPKIQAPHVGSSFLFGSACMRAGFWLIQEQMLELNNELVSMHHWWLMSVGIRA